MRSLKGGISMIVLLITIVVVIILASVTFVSIGNAVQNSRLTVLAQDLSTIDEATKSVYVLTGSYPVLNGTGEYSFSDLTNGMDQVLIDALKKEVEKNGDLNDTTFMKLDVEKMNLESVKRGRKDTEYDIFVMAYPSENIYYLNGIKAKGDYYFSLANITDNAKIKVKTTVNSSSISYTKNIKNWSNQLDIDFSVNISDNTAETVTFKFDGGNAVTLAVQNGLNDFKVTSFTKVHSNTKNTDTSLQAPSATPKFLTITKSKSGAVVETVNISLANYDNTLPSIDKSSLKVNSDIDKNTLEVNVSDTLSGVKEIKYDYLRRLSSSAGAEYYYNNVTSFNLEYMKTNAKTAKIYDNKVELEIPKDVYTIVYYIVDKAGNYSEQYITDIYSKDRIAIFASAKLVTASSNKYSVDVSVYSTENLKKITTSISSDNETYVDAKEATTFSRSNNISKVNFEYNNLSSQYIYVKIEATDILNNSESTIVKLDVSEYAGNLFAESNVTIKGTKYEITIPKDFAPVTLNDDGTVKSIIPVEKWNNKTFSDSVINQGVVIVDKYENEFVWIPVPITYNKFSDVFYREDFGGDTFVSTGTATEPSSFNNSTAYQYATEVVDYNLMYSQVEKYHGFYIARYEAGDDDVTTFRTGVTPAHKVVSKKDAIPYNYVAWGENMTSIGNNGAVYLSKNFATQYGYTSVASTLVYGIEWDRLVRWIRDDGYDIDDTKSYSNVNNATGNANVGSYGIKTTGYSKYWKVKNVYDIGGNLLEWTMEAYGTAFRTFCSGSYAWPGKNLGISTGGYFVPTYNWIDVGFRVALYIN